MKESLAMKGLVLGIIVLFVGAGVVPNVSENVSASIGEGLIAYWSFDDESDIGHDDSENGHNGINHGATSVLNGISGRALSFDGVDDYVEIPDTSDFQFVNQSLTITAWVQIVDNADLYRQFVYVGATTSAERICLSLAKARSGYMDGRIYMIVRNGDPVAYGAYSNLNGDNLPKNTWMFLTGVVDYPNSIKLYINGVLQEGIPCPDFDMSDVQQLGINIGRTAYGDSYHNSLIDEVRIYNRALSANELYNLWAEYGEEVFDVTWTLPQAVFGNRILPDTIWMGHRESIWLTVQNQKPSDEEFFYGLNQRWITDVPGKESWAWLSSLPYDWDEKSDVLESEETKNYEFEVKYHWDWIYPWGVGNIIDIILTILPGVGKAAETFNLFTKTVKALKIAGDIADVISLGKAISDAADAINIDSYAAIEFEGIGDSSPGIPFVIRNIVPPDKLALYIDSMILMMPAGLITLAAFTPFTWWLLGVQAGLIISSQALYIAAYDPDPNYTELVDPEFIYPTELDYINDSDARKVAYDLFTAVGYLQALKASFAKYQGALHDGDDEWALRQLSAVQIYSQKAYQYLEPLHEFIKPFIVTPTQEQIDSMQENFSKYGLPEYEQSILKQFGWTQEEIDELGADFATIPDEVYYETDQIPTLLNEAISILYNQSEYHIVLERESLFADLEVDPDTLNASGLPDSLYCYVEFENLSDLTGYQISSAILNGQIEPLSISRYPSDYDGDGIPDFLIEYDTGMVVSILEEGERLLSVLGNVTLPSNDIVLYSGASLIIIDTTPPEVSAEFIPVDVEEDEGLFEVTYSATDNCDPNPEVIAVIILPELIDPEIEFKMGDKIKLEFDLEENEIEVKGPEPEALWQEIQELGGLKIEMGQEVYIEPEEDLEEVEIKYENSLLKIEGYLPALKVTATDVSGNVGDVTVQPIFQEDDD